MFKKVILAATLCFVLNCADSFAFDMSATPYWGKNNGVSAIAYFRLPFNGAATRDTINYGFALTSALGAAKTPSFRTRLDDLHLLDLKFDGAGLNSVNINNSAIVMRQSSQGPNARYAMNVDAMEFATIAVVAGIAGLLVAVGDDESDRYCGDQKLTDNEGCFFISPVAPLK